MADDLLNVGGEPNDGLFVAQITNAIAGSGAFAGQTVYDFTEVTPDLGTGNYIVPPSPNAGTYSLNGFQPMVEVNNNTLTVGTIVWARMRTVFQGQPLYECEMTPIATPATSGASIQEFLYFDVLNAQGSSPWPYYVNVTDSSSNNVATTITEPGTYTFWCPVNVILEMSNLGSAGYGWMSVALSDGVSFGCTADVRTYQTGVQTADNATLVGCCTYTAASLPATISLRAGIVQGVLYGNTYTVAQISNTGGGGIFWVRTP